MIENVEVQRARADTEIMIRLLGSLVEAADGSWVIANGMASDRFYQELEDARRAVRAWARAKDSSSATEADRA